jgi:hypothetical protein
MFTNTSAVLYWAVLIIQCKLFTFEIGILLWGWWQHSDLCHGVSQFMTSLTVLPILCLLTYIFCNELQLYRKLTITITKVNKQWSLMKFLENHLFLGYILVPVLIKLEKCMKIGNTSRFKSSDLYITFWVRENIKTISDLRLTCFFVKIHFSFSDLKGRYTFVETHLTHSVMSEIYIYIL